jgi:hypothetical protein
MRKLLVLIVGLILSAATPLFADPGAMVSLHDDDPLQVAWSRTFNYANYTAGGGNGVAIDDSGDVYVVGQTGKDADYWTYVLLKYDKKGKLIWNRQLDKGLNGTSYGIHVAVKGDSVYTIGFNEASGTWVYWVHKWDKKGTMKWEKSFAPGNYGSGIDVDKDGNTYVTGQAFIDGNWRDWTLKLTPDGDKVWEKSTYYSLGKGSYGFAIAVDDDNVYVTGATVDSSKTIYLLLVTYDRKTGNCESVQELKQGALGFGIKADKKCVYVTGICNSNYDFSKGDLLTVKFKLHKDNHLIKQWEQTESDSPDIITGSDLDLDHEGNVYVSGWKQNSRSGLVVKYDEDGRKIWAVENASSSYAGIAVDDSKRVYVCGTQLDKSGNFNILLVKYQQERED